GIKALKQHLFQKFQTKDLGTLRYFLGIELAQLKSVIRIPEYMKSSLGKVLVLTNKGNTNIIGYSDAAGAEDASDAYFWLSHIHRLKYKFTGKQKA
ncbi:hypothetical protein A2U01_0037121, partial [Trifolium medium]|nr:hypothetical protein [Trifolium medium]